MTNLEVFDTVIKALTFVSVGIAAYSILQSSRNNRRQWHVNVFTTYAKRYECIMESFPEDAYMLRCNLYENVSPSKELSLAVLKYLNLVSEEYYLWKEDYINDKLWKIWEDEIKRTLRSPVMNQEWQNLRNEFRSFPEFCDFVDDTQASVDLFPRKSTRPTRR